MYIHIMCVYMYIHVMCVYMYIHVMYTLHVYVSAYECGFEPFGNPRVPFSVKFFLVGILFSF